MPFAYTGTDARIYPAYRDAERDATLEAVPGGVYAVTAPPGVPVPPPDGRWAALPPAESPAPPQIPQRAAGPQTAPDGPQAAPGAPETIPAAPEGETGLPEGEE